MLHTIEFQKLRNHCREVLETLEIWLKNIIDYKLTKEYGNNYFQAILPDEKFLIKKSIREDAIKFHNTDKIRYPRVVDACTLDNLIEIVSNPKIYKMHFKEAFKEAFPDGHSEMKTFLNRLKSPRNNLSHANPISIRQAERIICYSNDIISSLKNYYIQVNMAKKFNVPTITAYNDSLGNRVHVNQFNKSSAYNFLNYRNSEEKFLTYGEYHSFEIETDTTYKDNFTVTWSINGLKQIEFTNKKKISFKIEKNHIGVNFSIICKIISNNDWHKCGDYDDMLMILIDVYPN
jgi:hypothetical protein